MMMMRMTIPRHEIGLWNVYDLKEGHRTINAVESLHSGMKKKYPVYYSVARDATGQQF